MLHGLLLPNSRGVKWAVLPRPDIEVNRPCDGPDSRPVGTNVPWHGAMGTEDGVYFEVLSPKQSKIGYF